MASNISPEDRKRMEKFISEYPPYEDDAPEVNHFDGPPDAEPERAVARLYKLLLDGKLDTKNPKKD